MKRNGWMILMGLLMVVLIAMECSAQQATSFDQLPLLIKPGDTVYVTDFSGNTVKGRITQLSSTSLGLTVNGNRRDLLQTNVSQIRQWRGDSLKNGAWIGFAVGLGVGTLASIDSCRNSEACAPAAAILLPTMGGLGAAVGVGLDALIPAKQTIYQNQNRTSRKFHIGPVLNRKDKGVKVAFSF
jgi:hypothetical protein